MGMVIVAVFKTKLENVSGEVKAPPNEELSGYAVFENDRIISEIFPSY